MVKTKGQSQIGLVLQEPRGDSTIEQNKQPVIALALITAFCLAGDSMLYIVLPTHWKEVGLTSLVQVGILLSVNRFVRLPLNPIIGYIYKKINFRTGILIAVLFSSITTISYGVVENFSIWIILRSVWGFSWSMFKLGAYLMVLELSSDSNRGYLMGSYNGLYRLGSLIGMLLGGIFADLFGVMVISTALGLTALMTIPFIFKYIPTFANKKETAGTHQLLLPNIKSIFNQKLIMIMITAFLLTMLFEGMITATLSHLIHVKYSNHINLFEVIIGAATVAGLIQALRWGIAPFVVPKVGRLLDKVQYKNRTLALFLALAFLTLLVLPIDLPILIWLPILLIHLLVASSLTTIMDGLVTEHTARVANRIFIMTTFTIVVDLGAALGPILGYTLENKLGLTNLLWLAGLKCFLLSISWLFLQYKRTNQTTFYQHM